MRTVSNEMAAAMRGNSTLLAKAVLTLDGAQASEEIPPTRIMDARFEQHTSSESSFDLGGAIVGTASVTLWNGDGHFDDYDFTDAVMACYVGKALGATTEWVLIGTYIVDQPDSYAGTIGLSLNDKLSLLSEKKFSDSGLAYPILPLTAMTSMINSCGIAYIIDCTPVNNAVAISRAPDDDMTLLDAVGHLAQLMGLWLRCDGQGFVHAGWYDTSAFDVGGDYQELGSPYSETVMLDDVIITGVRVTASDEIVVDDDGNETNGDPGETAMSGSDGYVLSVASNPFVEYGRAAGVASGLFLRAGGMEFRPFERSMPCNPAVEAGDAVSFEDLRGNEHHSYATCAKIVVNGAMELKCSAKSAARNSSAASRASTAAIVKMRSMLEREKTGREVSDNTIMLIAQDAKDVADAVGQHFWHRSTDPDGDGAGTGAFVTDTEREDFLEHINDPTETRLLHNLLMNAEGILLRAAKKIRAAFTPSGVAFYDGAGNDAGNIVASFGKDGAVVGRETESSIIIRPEYMVFNNRQGIDVGSIEPSDATTSLARRYSTGALGVMNADGDTLTFSIDNVHPVQGALGYYQVYTAVYTYAGGAGHTDRWGYVISTPNGSDTQQPNRLYVSVRTSDGVATFTLANHYGAETIVNGVTVEWTENGYAPTFRFGDNTASGAFAFAEGHGTSAASYGHAEGYGTEAHLYSHAEGYGTQASGSYSHAQGRSTIAASSYQHVIGRYNVTDSANTYVEIVGNGDVNGNTRSNARTLDWNGNEVLAGTSTATAHNGFRGRTNLASTDNIDTLYTTGIYYIGSGGVGGTLPSGVTSYASLITMGGSSETSTGYVGKQIILSVSGVVWIRAYAGAPRAWGAWVQMVGGIPVSVANGGTGASTASPNRVFAGPSSGTSAAAPSFRALVAADVPSLAASKITSGTFDAARIPNLNTSKLTAGTLGIARGGTGSSTVVSVLANTTRTVLAWGPLVMVQLHGATGTPSATATLNTNTLASYKPAYNVSAIVADTSGHLARLWVEADTGSIKLAAVNYTSSSSWYGTLVYMRVPS